MYVCISVCIYIYLLMMEQEGETIQASKVPTEKISTSKGYYKLLANDVKEIEERDEVSYLVHATV